MRTQQPFSQSARWPSLDIDRTGGCIRDVDHAHRNDGGLAVLTGNFAPDGCIVKTAGVAEEMLTFSGRTRVYESQDDAVAGILGGSVRPGDVVVIRYEGPRGGPGMQEMLYPTAYLKSADLDRTCALVTDGRFSGGSSGLSVGHVSPEAAEGGTIAVICDGDRITIDIPGRLITLHVDEGELLRRRQAEVARDDHAFRPHSRERPVSLALRAYAALTTSAARGAVRSLERVDAPNR